jgi:sigma-B regulation protein RsbU (phosphoserine phosphatase)
MDGLRALSSGRVLDDVLTLVIDSALDTTRAERGFIMLANEQGELEFRIARGRGGRTLDRSFATSVKIPREVFASGVPKVVDDLDLPPGDDNSMIAFGIRRVLCVPLRVTPMMTRAADVPTGRVIGVLYLDQTSPGRAQSSALLRSVEAFATQAALAIDSARLYAEAAEKARVDRDLRVAAEIQRSLLAQPSYAGAACELAAISVPCRTIGGDFYDYLETEDGRLAFALGDVAGKGPPAALLAAALQSNFAAYASFGSDAARTTAAVNAALLRRPIEARFATMFHGVLTRDGQLSYCNGGHDLPFVLGADGVRWLDKGGPVLGLFKDAVYLSETIQLSENDLIVICSDGVTEAVNRNGEEFSRDRVVAAVTACPDRKAETVLDQLVATVREFSGGTPQADDMTVMVLRVGPHGAASMSESR